MREAEGRSCIGHFLSSCDYISKADKRNLVQTNKVYSENAASDDGVDDAVAEVEAWEIDNFFRMTIAQAAVIKVTTCAPPSCSAYYGHYPVTITW